MRAFPNPNLPIYAYIIHNNLLYLRPRKLLYNIREYVYENIYRYTLLCTIDVCVYIYD